MATHDKDAMMTLGWFKVFLKRPYYFLVIGCLGLFICGIQLCLLKALPYSTSWLERAPASLDQPSPDFGLGTLKWDVKAYAASAELEPLRRYFNATCKHQTGVKAALAITRDFEKRFPFGQPRLDFFSPSFQLLEDFNEHVEKGAPGHCVTYSGLLVATLLSGGCPARVVQVYSQSGIGHNIAEVWDDEKGWVLVDPSQRALINTGEKRTFLEDGDEVVGKDTRIVQVGSEVSKDKHLGTAFYLDIEDGVLKGPRVYPEPWLYLRCGPKAAPWPFRGAFAVVGSRPWRLGIWQRMLDIGIIASGAIGVISLFFGILRIFRPSRNGTGVIEQEQKLGATS